MTVLLEYLNLFATRRGQKFGGVASPAHPPPKDPPPMSAQTKDSTKIIPFVIAGLVLHKLSSKARKLSGTRVYIYLQVRYTYYILAFLVSEFWHFTKTSLYLLI